LGILEEVWSMTQPKIGTIKRGGARLYVHPITGEKAIGVTSVLNSLPKPFLQHWRAKVVAEAAVNNAGTLTQMLLDANGEGRNFELGRKAAVDWLKGAPNRDTGKSAEDGTAVHDLCEKLAKGIPTGPIHPDYVPYIDNFKTFLDKFQPEFLFLEDTVWNEEHGYAGSFDWIAKIQGETVLGDNKTTRSGVHAEVALQLAAYANADYILKLVEPEPTPTTVEEPSLVKVDLPKLDGAAVLHLRPDTCSLVPISIRPEVYETFLTLLKVRAWEKDLSKSVLGAPIPIGPEAE